MLELTLIIGLPGSGKTHLANYLAKENTIILDDIKSQDQLLETDNDIIITDPNFCKTDVLNNALIILQKKYPKHIIKKIFFENDRVKCLNNIKYRNDNRKVEKFIELLSRSYAPPSDSLEIWQQN